MNRFITTLRDRFARARAQSAARRQLDLELAAYRAQSEWPGLRTRVRPTPPTILPYGYLP